MHIFWSCARQCDLVLDAAHRKSPEPVGGPRKEDIVESIIFKASDVVVVTFKDVDPNFARKGIKTEISIAPVLCLYAHVCAVCTYTDRWSKAHLFLCKCDQKNCECKNRTSSYWCSRCQPSSVSSPLLCMCLLRLASH